MTDLQGGLDSPQEAGGEDRKSYIQEDPNSKAHLEALFEVIHTGNKGTKPMHERKLPNSFFNQGLQPPEGFGLGLHKHRLGPSISVGPQGGPKSEHLRSMSLPVNIEHSAHGRQYSYENLPLLPGWEMAKTADGLSYFIDHNTRTTHWDDPRKAMLARQARPSIPHQLTQQTMASQFPHSQQLPPQHVPPQHSQQASLDAMPLPDGWQRAYTQEGEVYYVNHKNRTTSWLHPSMAGHQHSHSFAGPGMSGVMSAHHRFAPHYSRHQQAAHSGMTLQQHLQADKDMLRKQQFQMPRQDLLGMAGGGVGEPKPVPTTMYGDPYLGGGSDHIRQTSHDSGLGGTSMPGYPPDFGALDLDEGMDTQASSMAHRGAVSAVHHGVGGGMHASRGRALDYLDSMPGTDVDMGMSDHTTGMDTDQPFPTVMGGGDILDLGKEMGGWV